MPTGVYKRTEETLKNIGKWNIGKVGYWADKKRPKFSKKWIENIKLSHKGQHSSPNTEFKKGEHKSPNTEFKKGHKLNIDKKRSKKTKRKISLVLTGRKLSEETKRKMGLSRSGDKCHFWEGGLSFEPYTTDWTKTLKRSIRERDKYTCQMCNEQQNDRAFDIHHIDYDKKNCNPNNLITLCRSCHTKTTTGNRENWKNYFIKGRLKDEAQKL